MKLVSYRDEFSFQGPIEPYDIHLKGENDLSSRPVWSADRVPEQPGRSREILGCGGYECLLCDATFLARGDTCLLIPDWKPKTDLTLTQPFMPAKYKLVNSEFGGLLTRIWVKVTYIRRKDSKQLNDQGSPQHWWQFIKTGQLGTHTAQPAGRSIGWRVSSPSDPNPNLFQTAALTSESFLFGFI